MLELDKGGPHAGLAAAEGATILKTAKEPRETAEARFDRIQRIVTNEADAERIAVRKKTARLKALRMERDAASQEAEIKEASLSSGKKPRRKRPVRQPS
jgi:hypothetical protein